jgi:RecA/RadA recombinase
MPSKLMQRMQKLDTAVVESKNPFLNVIETASPSMNFIFGKGWGLPRGYTMMMYGAPRGGKSVISNMMIANAQRDYPDHDVIKFNTEMREHLQLTDEDKKKYGIDKERYVCHETNDPVKIFDMITKDIEPALQDGGKVSLIIIDSLSSIRGRRDMNSESLETMQIGDKAKTIQDALGRILELQRKYDIALILTTQVRAEMDAMMQKVSKVKPDAAFGAKHYAEYYVYVEQGIFQSGRKDLQGNSLDDTSVTDLYSPEKGQAERRAHRIAVSMIDSSAGPKGRNGEFTFDFQKLQVINQHEEVFLLGTRRGVVERPTNQKYAFGGREWRGKDDFLNALKDDPALCQEILTEVKRRDNAGSLPEKEVEESP